MLLGSVPRCYGMQQLPDVLHRLQHFVHVQVVTAMLQ
jgi:hypothetical protein